MKNKKKCICIVLPAHWAAGFGGAEYQAQCLADALVESKLYDVIYLAGSTDPNYVTNKYKIYNVASTINLRRYTLFFDSYPLYKKLKLIKPDVIYQRVGCAYTGIAAKYAKDAGAEMIWHIAHDTDLLPFQEDISPKSIFKYIEYLCLGYGIRNTPKIIAQTKFQDDLLRENFGKKANAIVPNFHHSPNEKIIKKSPIKIVWVANLKPQKRPEIFIRLARKLSNLKDVKFIMIGKPQYKKKWTKNLKDSTKSIKNFESIENASFDCVNEILSKSHIFVNTSQLEGFPNTFIQSWMRKVPVVSLSINPDDVFNKQKVGYCSGSFEELVKHVKCLAIDHALRNKIGENACEYAMKMHSMKNANTIIELMR